MNGRVDSRILYLWGCIHLIKTRGELSKRQVFVIKYSLLMTMKYLETQVKVITDTDKQHVDQLINEAEELLSFIDSCTLPQSHNSTLQGSKYLKPIAGRNYETLRDMAA